jgi:hypothetical protein
MLEASNLDKAKAKKPSKPGNKPQQRFWPIQPNSSLKDDKDDEEMVLKPQAQPSTSPRKTAMTSAAPSPATIMTTLVDERGQQQIVATDATSLTSQTDTLMGFMTNGGRKFSSVLFFFFFFFYFSSFSSTSLPFSSPSFPSSSPSSSSSSSVTAEPLITVVLSLDTPLWMLSNRDPITHPEKKC